MSRILALYPAMILPQVRAMKGANQLGMAERDLRRVERAARRVDVARAELRQAILLARESGETFDAIGRAAGLSRQRVQQLVRGK